MTIRIGWIDKGPSPYVSFALEADVLSQSAGGNYTNVRFRLRASKGTGSYFNGSGAQRGYYGPSVNFGTHSPSPFLPSGSTGWNYSWDKRLDHDSNGYYRGSTSLALSMHLDYGNINEWHSGSMPIPRIPRAPGAPGTPSVSNVLPTSATLAWGAADRGHAAIIEYQVQTALNSGFTSGAAVATTGTTRSYTPTNLTPGVTYHARVRARNSDGWGSWSSAVQFETLAGGRLKHNDTWVNATPWVKHNGEWVRARPWIKHDGEWVTAR